jgi:DNA-binding NtrC family response regulator
MIDPARNESGNGVHVLWSERLRMSTVTHAKIVVVDDDEDFLECIACHIEQTLGCRPHLAESAAEALAHLRRHPTDILITDTNMPEVSGVQLLAGTKKEYPDLKVIVLFSGLKDSKINRKEILEMGAYMVLSKSEIRSDLLPFLKAFAVGRLLRNYVKLIFPRW